MCWAYTNHLVKDKAVKLSVSIPSVAGNYGNRNRILKIRGMGKADVKIRIDSDGLTTVLSYKALKVCNKHKINGGLL